MFLGPVRKDKGGIWVGWGIAILWTRGVVCPGETLWEHQMIGVWEGVYPPTMGGYAGFCASSTAESVVGCSALA